MPTTWTKVTRATGTTYTKVSNGYVLYTDPTITYSASNVSYSGNVNSWQKTTSPITTIVAGSPIGMFPLMYTYGNPIIKTTTPWTKIAKAT